MGIPLPGVSHGPHDSHFVPLPTGWERVWWEPLPSHGTLGWDGDVSMVGPVSLSMCECLVCLGGREAGCAKAKAD